RGWFVAVRVLIGLQVVATLTASALFLWLAFDPQRDGWGLVFLLVVHGVAVLGGSLVGLVPSLLLDLRTGVRFGRRRRIAALCAGLLLAELGVAALLHWRSVC